MISVIQCVYDGFAILPSFECREMPKKVLRFPNLFPENKQLFFGRINFYAERVYKVLYKRIIYIKSELLPQTQS